MQTTMPCDRFLSAPTPSQMAMMSLGMKLIAGWSLSCALLITSWWLIPYNLPYGLMVFASAIFTAMYMFGVSTTKPKDSQFQHELIITEYETLLFTFDLIDGYRFVQSLPMKHIVVGEHFIESRLASLALIAPGRHLEIPLWAFDDSSHILQAFRMRGVAIVDLKWNAVKTKKAR